jgi:hypothetical protein
MLTSKGYLMAVYDAFAMAKVPKIALDAGSRSFLNEEMADFGAIQTSVDCFHLSSASFDY